MGSAMDKMIEAHYFGIGRCKIRIPEFASKIPTLGGTFEPQSKWLKVLLVIREKILFFFQNQKISF